MAHTVAVLKHIVRRMPFTRYVSRFCVMALLSFGLSLSIAAIKDIA